MLIYSLEKFWAHRHVSLTAPGVVEARYFPTIEHQIHLYIGRYWKSHFHLLPYTFAYLEAYMMRFYLIAVNTWGFTEQLAMDFARKQVWQMYHVQVIAPVGMVVWPVLALIAGIVIYKLVTREWGDDGYVTFYPGQVLMAFENQLWWAGLTYRQSETVFWFRRCEPFLFVTYTQTMRAGLGVGKTDTFDFSDSIQHSSKRFLHYYVYTWSTLYTKFRGIAHQVGRDLWSMTVTSADAVFWGVPVGWSARPFETCDFLDKFDENWH